jgi:hypothetical protein
MRRASYPGRHGECSASDMNEDMDSVAAADIELECCTWDWARTAGVSAEELRAALLEAMRDSRQPLARAA